MIQLCICPGPHSVKDLFSFLQPCIQQLKSLQSSGICFKADNRERYFSCAHMLLCTGDTPGCSKMMCFRGHTFKYGCRICEIAGSPVKINGAKRGMYFAPYKRARPKKRSLEDFLQGSQDKGLRRVLLELAFDDETDIERALNIELEFLKSKTYILGSHAMPNKGIVWHNLKFSPKKSWG